MTLSDTDYPIPDTLKAARCVFKGTRFDVCTLDVKIDESHTIQRSAVVHPGAVVILPIVDQNTILLIRNQRFAVGERLWELPAGTLEPHEQPIATAHRELIEETGYQAELVMPLIEFYTSPGICTEKMYAFFATNLTYVGQALEETEDIQVEQVSWEKALEMAKEGLIRDGKSLVTLLHYHLFISNN